MEEKMVESLIMEYVVFLDGKEKGGNLFLTQVGMEVLVPLRIFMGKGTWMESLIWTMVEWSQEETMEKDQDLGEAATGATTSPSQRRRGYFRNP